MVKTHFMDRSGGELVSKGARDNNARVAVARERMKVIRGRSSACLLVSGIREQRSIFRRFTEVCICSKEEEVKMTRILTSATTDRRVCGKRTDRSRERRRKGRRARVYQPLGPKLPLEFLF
ncbi:unnamed protein product, partial [Ectocarpus sp. 6 AP-2014]